MKSIKILMQSITMTVDILETCGSFNTNPPCLLQWPTLFLFILR